MRKIIIIIIICVIYTCIVRAQVAINISLFKCTTWKVIEPKDKIEFLWQFSDKELKRIMRLNDQVRNGMVYTYYLSTSDKTVFDKSKVGKSTSGGYLYLYNSKLDNYTVWVVRSYDKTKNVMTLETATGNFSNSSAYRNSKYVVGSAKSQTIKLQLVSKDK